MEYAPNLCKYQSRSVTNLTIGDLRNVLTGLNGTSLSNTNTEPRDDESNVSTVGLYILLVYILVFIMVILSCFRYVHEHYGQCVYHLI